MPTSTPGAVSSGTAVVAVASPLLDEFSASDEVAEVAEVAEAEVANVGAASEVAALV